MVRMTLHIFVGFKLWVSICQCPNVFTHVLEEEKKVLRRSPHMLVTPRLTQTI